MPRAAIRLPTTIITPGSTTTGSAAGTPCEAAYWAMSLRWPRSPGGAGSQEDKDERDPPDERDGVDAASLCFRAFSWFWTTALLPVQAFTRASSKGWLEYESCDRSSRSLLAALRSGRSVAGG
jgi:hypothetical protein